MNNIRAEDIRIVLGRRVRLLRKRTSLSQEELALLCGLDRTYVGGIERGERNIGILSIEKIANGLGVSMRDLFDGKPKPHD